MIELNSRLQSRQFADLKPLRYLSHHRTAAPGAEPGNGELVPPLPARPQPCAVVASASAVIRANRVVAALRGLGPVAGDATRGGRRETAGVCS